MFKVGFTIFAHISNVLILFYRSVQPDNLTVAEKSTLADSTCTLTYERALSCEDFCLQVMFHYSLQIIFKFY